MHYIYQNTNFTHANDTTDLNDLEIVRLVGAIKHNPKIIHNSVITSPMQTTNRSIRSEAITLSKTKKSCMKLIDQSFVRIIWMALSIRFVSIYSHDKTK